MAKTRDTTRILKIEDLIRERKSFPLLEIPKFKVEITIKVTTTALLLTPPPAPEAKMKRLEAVARTKIEEYEKIITAELTGLSRKVDSIPDAAGRAKKVSEINSVLKNAFASTVDVASRSVEKALEAEARGDKLLAQARVLTGIKFIFIGVSLAASAARLAGSHGADVTAYVSIANSLRTLVSEIQQQVKKEPALRKDLEDGIQAYMKVRGTSVMQAARRQGLVGGTLPGFPAVIMFIAEGVVKAGKEVSKGRDKSAIAKEVGDFLVKEVGAAFKDVEQARQMYRNHTVKIREDVDALSAQADKLMAAMKNLDKQLPQKEQIRIGVKLGAECMQLKRGVTAMGKSLDDAKAFLADSEAFMKGFGLECDDRTIIEKFKALDKMTIATEGAGVVLKIQSVCSLVSAIVAVA